MFGFHNSDIYVIIIVTLRHPVDVIISLLVFEGDMNWVHKIKNIILDNVKE